MTMNNYSVNDIILCKCTRYNKNNNKTSSIIENIFNDVFYLISKRTEIIHVNNY